FPLTGGTFINIGGSERGSVQAKHPRNQVQEGTANCGRGGKHLEGTAVQLPNGQAGSARGIGFLVMGVAEPQIAAGRVRPSSEHRKPFLEEGHGEHGKTGHESLPDLRLWYEALELIPGPYQR